ncbi:hypothetical protein ILYODFUR_032909 [Ilyodon furcidens]|uniref:Uncharacterized protein n=1 Tax=Ilyodon furcidens TaxID=33524 RepID=A0ABV0TGI9_9TELE
MYDVRQDETAKLSFKGLFSLLLLETMVIFNIDHLDRIHRDTQDKKTMDTQTLTQKQLRGDNQLYNLVFVLYLYPERAQDCFGRTFKLHAENPRPGFLAARQHH